MSDYPPNVILDESGAPCGLLRANQDPGEDRRLHPVPKVNALGEPILEDDGTPVVHMLPLTDPRTVAQLELEGFVVDGVNLVAIPGHPLTDPPVED